MFMRISGTGLVFERTSLSRFPLEFHDSTLHGVGQVILQNNSYARLLFPIGIFHNSPLFGFTVLVGTAAITAAAMLLAADRSLMRAGRLRQRPVAVGPWDGCL